MTQETRRALFRYGVAVDLVVLAAGVGLLYPGRPLLLFAAFTTAVVIAAWKGGWRAGAAALFVSLVVLLTMFRAELGAARLVAFTGAAIAATAIVTAAQIRGRERRVVAAGAPFEAPPGDPEEARRASEMRRDVARALERAAAEQLEASRAMRAASPAQPQPAGETPADDAGPAAEGGTQAPDSTEAERTAPEPHPASAEQFPVPLVAEAAADDSGRSSATRTDTASVTEARVSSHAPEPRRRKSRKKQPAADIPLDVEAVYERQVESARASLNAEADARYAAATDATRKAVEDEIAERIRRERDEAEAALRARVGVEREHLQAELDARLNAEREAARADLERTVAERLAPERQTIAAEMETRLEEERVFIRRQIEERFAAARAEEERAGEETLRRRLESERATIAERIEAQIDAARQEMEREAAARLEAIRKATEADVAARIAAGNPNRIVKAASVVRSGILGTVAGWLHRPKARSVNLATRKMTGNATAARRAVAPAPKRPVRPPQHRTAERKPRLLLLERRRATADTIVPKVRQRGVEIEVVERWVDAVDEIFRFRPDALLVDSEIADFPKIYATLLEQRRDLPIFITGRSANGDPAHLELRHAGFVPRPYDPETLAGIGREAVSDLTALLARQAMTPVPPRPAPRAGEAPAQRRPAVAPAVAKPAGEQPVPHPEHAVDSYQVICFNCRSAFEATDSEWCSCLTKERTLVCTNCLSCFCKAPASYKEKFWIDAPPRLFERKAAEARRHQRELPENPAPGTARRPLVLCVEDDDEIQRIVLRVCTNLGYGFIHSNNGQDGLELARAHRPELILSDAFMPKLDGREMCRLYKDEAPECTTIVMTGLYTDTKYRSEALKRFHVDEYLSKPVAVTDLVTLLQRHIEGASALPDNEDLQELDAGDSPQVDGEGIALEDLLAGQSDQTAFDIVPLAAPKRPKSDAYEVCCFTCNEVFDAVRAEWCSCVGRDQTLVCNHCHNCFCKAPSIYKERFWTDAPGSLFERKLIGSKRNTGAVANPAPGEVKRPLILLVEDDENIQLIVRTVVTTMGYGFVAAGNGQDGLALAREYNPDLVLSDAFMPKLDGREMCRLLKEDPTTAGMKAIIMTGLYTDRKYRNEALDYFRVDDYVAKPVAVDDLIRLFKKHLPQEVQATM